MAKTQFLQFTMHLTDAARVAELQGTTDPGSNQAVGAIIRAPYAAGPPPAGASVEFDAPILAKGAPFVAPCTDSPWFYTDANFPLDVATFTRKSGGWFGIPFLFGTTVKFYWRGTFEYSAPPDESGTPGEVPVPMAMRRWIDGFELPPSTNAVSGEAGANNGNQYVGRGSSRHVDGFGLGISDQVHVVQHSPTDGGAAATREVWERFYIRPRAFGTAASIIHVTNGGSSGSSGARLSVLPSGQLLIEKLNAAAVATTLGSSTQSLVLHTWHRIDLVYRYTDGGSKPAVYAVNVNGVQWFTTASFGTDGLGQNQTAGNSKLGGSQNQSHFDFDDWVGSDWPTGGVGAGSLPGLDWNNGSRIKRVVSKQFAASNGTFAGQLRTLDQRPVDTANGPPTMTSSTGNDRLCIVLDTENEVDRFPNQVGIAAMNVGVFASRAGVANGQLGYKVPGGAEVLATITESTTAGWLHVLYAPSGLATPVTPMAGTEITYVHNANATLATVYALQATMEVLGQFYEEDKPPVSSGVDVEAPARQALHHNAPYPRTPWALPGPPPISGVEIVGGTYVGNGTTIDINIASPVHFLMIRRADNTVPPVYWWSCAASGHLGGNRSYRQDSPVNVTQDFGFAAPVAEDDQSMQFIIRVTGALTNSNAAGVTYQYIAFCDPGMRFSLGDGIPRAINDYVHPIGYEGWTPEVVFVQGEFDATNTLTTLFKGLGSTGDNITLMSGSEVTGLTVAENALTVRSGLTGIIGNLAASPYLAFRRQDGNNDPGEARVLQLATYTGDGSASRTISLAPASSRRPLFAIVVPHNAGAIVRDPSHTGTTSMTYAGTSNAGTGITAGGIDQITVGSALNSNGIVYDVFVFPGDSTAGNNGWSVNGTFWPVEPTSPASGGPFIEEPEEPGEPTDGGGGGGGGGGTDEESFDFSEDCAAPSTKIINKALSYIGVSKQVGDITTEASLEAVTARLHYSDDVSATLRDYPWAFATRYETLVLVDGSEDDPVNGDWVYAYRAPERMMFARRIVNPDGSRRDYDPAPIKFRVGSDDDGILIYTNQVDPELEYTLRLDCVALAGDAIFRKALTWRHASSLAPAIARDEKKVQFAMALYQATLEEARVRDAREQQQAPEGDVDWITGRN